jgi:hypothetical protein
MLSIAGVLAALVCAALFAGAIACFLRAYEGPLHKKEVYSVDKRPLLVRIKSLLHKGMR